MDVTEEYTDVLQNIEFAIVSIHQRQPMLVDFDVDAALNALTAHYQAQAIGREARPTRLNERAQQVYDAMKTMCEWRMGNIEAVSADMRKRGPRPVAVSGDVIIACLKRIRKSVQRWNKEGGRQGYLTFIERFIQ
jgi:predicted metal-dependent hydrolase